MVTADTSPVRFVLINTLQGTEREKQLQLKHNMLQSRCCIFVIELIPSSSPNQHYHYHVVIKKLKRDQDAAEFINFVDKGRAKGYYDIIKYPMCLQEIEDRINRHQCDTCEVV